MCYETVYENFTSIIIGLVKVHKQGRNENLQKSTLQWSNCGKEKQKHHILSAVYTSYEDYTVQLFFHCFVVVL